MNQPADDKQQALDERTAEERDRLQVVFGEALRKLRHSQDLTLEKLAERAELHTNYVGSVERGERNISLFNIWRLALALNLPATELMQALPAHRLREPEAP
ncbi:MAG: helix-turn-helix transcriptional regulator [Burkholderiales bacterium]|nr:helix-turn-helix transcriptional regulator [Burkholderiales bacterium]